MYYGLQTEKITDLVSGRNFIYVCNVYRWENNGVGMGGKDAGPGTQEKPGVGKGKDYEAPEFFEYNQYSYFDIEKEIVDGNKRVEQPQSGLTEYW